MERIYRCISSLVGSMLAFFRSIFFSLCICMLSLWFMHLSIFIIFIFAILLCLLCLCLRLNIVVFALFVWNRVLGGEETQE